MCERVCECVCVSVLVCVLAGDVTVFFTVRHKGKRLVGHSRPPPSRGRAFPVPASHLPQQTSLQGQHLEPNFSV